MKELKKLKSLNIVAEFVSIRVTTKTKGLSCWGASAAFVAENFNEESFANKRSLWLRGWELVGVINGVFPQFILNNGSKSIVVVMSGNVMFDSFRLEN